MVFCGLINSAAGLINLKEAFVLSLLCINLAGLIMKDLGNKALGFFAAQLVQSICLQAQ